MRCVSMRFWLKMLHSFVVPILCLVNAVARAARLDQLLHIQGNKSRVVGFVQPENGPGDGEPAEREEGLLLIGICDLFERAGGGGWNSHTLALAVVCA